jgi:hypothetical protein
LAWPLQRYIALRYDSLEREVSLVRISAMVAAVVLIGAVPNLAAAQQPAKGRQHEQPAARRPDAPAQAPRTQAEPRRTSPPPSAARPEPRRAEPAERPAPKSTGEPELKRRKPEPG